MTETIIELRDLSIGYGNKKVLQNINAKINKGEIVGIIGCNGAGKSTLLKTIRGLLSKQSGDICILVVIWKALLKKNWLVRLLTCSKV